jgi:hypothetical protein
MEISILISAGIILIIIFLVFTIKPNSKTTEYFGFNLGKSISKATKTVSTGVKSAATTVARGAPTVARTVAKTATTAAKTVTSAAKTVAKTASAAIKSASKVPKPSKQTIAISNAAVLNNVAATKNIVDETQKIIDRTTKMSISINNQITSLTRKIEQLGNRIKSANQKKIFTIYLNRKTAAKIAFLNSLITIATTIANTKSQKSPKQIEILKNRILTQLYAVKIYFARANSYNCQTRNLFFQIETGFSNIIESNSELQGQISNFNAIVTETSRSVTSTNEKIVNVNNQINEANKPPPPPPEEAAPEATTDSATPDSSSDAGSDTASDAGSDASSDTSSDVEGFALENIALFDLLTFDIGPITIPVNIVIPTRQSIPILVPNELIVPEFIEPKLTTLFTVSSGRSSAPASVPTRNRSQEEILIDFQAESELQMIITNEEFVPIPSDADPLDIENENELIYELS